MHKRKKDSIELQGTTHCRDCEFKAIKVMDAMAQGTKHNKETGHRVVVLQLVQRTTTITGKAVTK